MFFDPHDYLTPERGQTKSERERARLVREAEQRAKLCEATTRLAARGGLEAAAIHLAARSAGVGQGTYYKLYDSREACLQEAFERCAEVILARVEVAAARDGGDFANRLEAGLSELLALLDTDPDVAHLLLVAILAGDVRCREARERCRSSTRGSSVEVGGGPVPAGRARRVDCGHVVLQLVPLGERAGEAGEAARRFAARVRTPPNATVLAAGST